MSLVDEYCRELEGYLCRKNDGHLIRIVGPAFEKVAGWARQGIPLKVAQAGLDRCFERYYRKGPRRRPVRIEFCEADVLDAFDRWRRAVGISAIRPDADGGPLVEEPVPAPPRARRSLSSHIERTIARLTVLRGGPCRAGMDAALDEAVRALDALRAGAGGARGPAREAIVDRIEAIDGDLLAAAERTLTADERSGLADEAERELTPFRARMDAVAYERARHAAWQKLVRDRVSLPDVGFS